MNETAQASHSSRIIPRSLISYEVLVLRADGATISPTRRPGFRFRVQCRAGAGSHQSKQMNKEEQEKPGDPWDLTGKLLEGRYLVESQLGRGGLGVVYLARDTKLMEKRVVVKVLLDQLGNDDDTADWVRRKFQEEIEPLARIDPPGVVGVMHAGDLPDGRPFIVMQYIEGGSLRSLMKQGPMEFARAANILRQIGHARSEER